MHLRRPIPRSNRTAQVFRVLRQEGLGSVSRKAMRFARSRLSSYKSQKGQDRWVLETLRGKQGGYFVDLAASDGLTFSNTWIMEKKFGWTGIAIEPNPMLYALLAKRRKCQTLDVAVDCQEGAVPFRIDIGGRGGIVSDDSEIDLLNSDNQMDGAKIVQILAKTLGEILSQAEAPKVMDYLSLDVEGSEERVLRGLDLSEYTFYCVTIETPSNEVKRMLSENGYYYVKSKDLDTFYVHASHPCLDSIDTQPIEVL